MLPRTALTAAVILALPGVPRSATAGITAEAAGYAELRFAAMPGVDGTWWSLSERLRPRFEASLHERVRLVAEGELRLTQGRHTQTEFQDAVDESDFAPLLELAECTWPEDENTRLHINTVGDYLSIERLYLDLYLPGVDLRIGRQPLFWGSAAMLNPTDPFPELLVTEPWRPRRGTNAIRALVPLDADSDLTTVVGTSDLFSAVRLAGRWRRTVGPVDLAFVAAYRGDDEDGLFGIDLRGNTGIGWWFEGALHMQPGGVREELAIGIDYSFPVLDGLVLVAQYYRNGRHGAGTSALARGIEPPHCHPPEAEGATVSTDLSTLLFPTGGTATFAPLLSGSDYLMLAVTQIFARELSLSVTALQNLEDGTGLLVPTLTARPWGFVEIAASAQIGYRLGEEGGEFRPDDKSLVRTFDLGPLLGERTLDLRGLAPDATISVWTRFSF